MPGRYDSKSGYELVLARLMIRADLPGVADAGKQAPVGQARTPGQIPGNQLRLIIAPAPHPTRRCRGIGDDGGGVRLAEQGSHHLGHFYGDTAGPIRL